LSTHIGVLDFLKELIEPELCLAWPKSVSPISSEKNIFEKKKILTRWTFFDAKAEKKKKKKKK